MKGTKQMNKINKRPNKIYGEFVMSVSRKEFSWLPIAIDMNYELFFNPFIKFSTR